jgi:hypothetical protein
MGLAHQGAEGFVAAQTTRALDEIHQKNSLIKLTAGSDFVVSEEKDFGAWVRAEHLCIAPHRTLFTDEFVAHRALMQPQYF